MVLVDDNETAAENTKEQFEKAYGSGKVLYCKCDVTNADQVKGKTMADIHHWSGSGRDGASGLFCLFFALFLFFLPFLTGLLVIVTPPKKNKQNKTDTI